MEKEIIDGEASIKISPADNFEVSYLIDYNIPCIEREVFSIKLNKESFEKEIAPARTFCLKAEAEALLKAGLGKGADLKNTLVLDADGPIGTEFRYPNEPVRHKILDLVGDFYMLAAPVVAKVEAKKSGHALNAKMLKYIFEEYIQK